MLALPEAWEWTEKEVFLHALPLFHVHGLNVATHGSLFAGSTIVMRGKFEPRSAWEALERERCSLRMAVPTICQRLMGETYSKAIRPSWSRRWSACRTRSSARR
jgi:malonyl-CoA/methylmalonyl-CoA synthetase